MKIIEKTIPMQRLPYVLPEWTRMMWSSEEIRIKWEGKIQRASTAWLEIEERSVEHGLRDSALLFVEENAFLEKSKYYAKKGLVLQPLEKSCKHDTYSSSGKSWISGQPFMYRVVLTKQELVSSWIDAWEGNNSEIGKLLGFPSCCIEFFEKFWVQQKFLDTTWPMFQNTWSEGHFKANILLRWMGIRLVSHLPCAFNCLATIQLATKNLQLFDKLGFAEYADDINNLLQLPVEWSAKHGIAEIKTPLFKISTRTDATEDLYVVQREGNFYPVEAPSGNKFPYKNTQKNLLTQSKSFKSALVNVDPSLEWKDNGFVSLEAMDMAHINLVKHIKLLEDIILDDVDSVVDLGCGNGILLSKLQQQLPHIKSWNGMEIDFDRAKRAQFRNPEFRIYNSDIFINISEQFDIGIISFNRLLERNLHHSTWDHLFEICKYIIVYSYDDVEELNGLIEASALPLKAKIYGTKVKLVTLKKVNRI